NPSFEYPGQLSGGRVVPGFGWVDTDYLGIDQGPIVAMLENHRTGLVWKVMRKSPYLRAGLERAGFQGGWLGSPP
ncbi:MAG TPA: glucoamylase family protein, partial [Myxococcales bacterium]|nr:glucoamylase family protein [Myxococcales bacterium]